MAETKSEYKIEGRPSTIFRVEKNKDNPYVMIDKRIIDNDQLSYKAKGILVYLLSRPDGWEVNQIDITNRSTDGGASIKSGIKELKEAGYIKHAGTRSKSGQFKTVIWEVYEVPQVGNQPTVPPHIGVTPQVDLPQVENPQVDNHRQVLKKLSINKKEVVEEEGIIKQATTTSSKGLTNETFSNKVFTKITGMVVFPAGGKEDAIKTIEALRSRYDTTEKMVVYLTPFWKEWTSRPYRKTNLAWLTDWAVSGEIPAAKSASTDKKKEFDAEMKRRGLQPMEEVR